jgi:hypothetical protein
MRRRPLVVLVSVSLLAIGGGAAALATSSAARRPLLRHPRPTIDSRPNPSTAGEGVMIFGRVLFARTPATPSPSAAMSTPHTRTRRRSSAPAKAT